MQQRKNRLRWQCRRGMLELDMMLMPFIDEAFMQLSEAEQDSFEALLAHEDSELFPWLMLRETPENSEMQHIVNLIVSHARES